MANLATARRSRLRWAQAAKALAPPLLWSALYRRLVVGDIADVPPPIGRTIRRGWTPDFAARFATIEPYTEVSAANALDPLADGRPGSAR